MEAETKLTLRLPAGLHALLVARAAADERSLNGEIVYLLRDALTPLAEADAYAATRTTLLEYSGE